MNENKTKIIVICGPTATGKSLLAVDIAEKFGGEVINADSMQIYRDMNIAAAIPTKAEMNGIPHHLYEIADRRKSFSVAEWLTAAKLKIKEITESGENPVIPVITGGTGLYISSLVNNIVFDNAGIDYDFRAEMYRLAETRGNAYLLERLREVDPDYAAELHENNLKRIIRALETYKISGNSAAVRIEQSRAESPVYNACMLGLGFEDRQELYERINSRVDSMIAVGLVEEARKAFESRNSDKNELGFSTALQAIGHKELFPFFEGTESLEDCIENIKKKTRNYAKRQLTWFRKETRINWLLIGENRGYDYVFKKACGIVEDFLAGKN